MKRIPLTQGKFTLVDDEDYDFLMRWKWHYANGYAKRCEYVSCVHGKRKNKIISMHAVIFKPDVGEYIDHYDGDKLNNKRDNLRLATKSQNAMNKKKPSHAVTSKYKGISLDKERNNYRAAIRLGGKLKSLGRFSSEIDAARAYNAAALQHFGEFAKVNPC